MIKYESNPEIIIPYIEMEAAAAIARCHCHAYGKEPRRVCFNISHIWGQMAIVKGTQLQEAAVLIWI